VEDPSENVVLATLALGDLVAYIDPDVFFDPQGNLHILQPIAMSTYLYTRADPSGKILHQAVFKSAPVAGMAGLVPPRLHKLDDGSITVEGGAEQDINQPQETLSEGQKIANGPVEKKPDASTAGPDSTP